MATIASIIFNSIQIFSTSLSLHFKRKKKNNEMKNNICIKRKKLFLRKKKKKIKIYRSRSHNTWLGYAIRNESVARSPRSLLRSHINDPRLPSFRARAHSYNWFNWMDVFRSIHVHLHASSLVFLFRNGTIVS